MLDQNVQYQIQSLLEGYGLKVYKGKEVDAGKTYALTLKLEDIDQTIIPSCIDVYSVDFDARILEAFLTKDKLNKYLAIK